MVERGWGLVGRAGERRSAARRAHLPVRAAPTELGGERPQVDVVFVAKAVGADPVLLVVALAAEAHGGNVMRPLADGRSRPRVLTIVDATAMRFDPAPMPRPDLLQRAAYPQLWPLQPIGQPH